MGTPALVGMWMQLLVVLGMVVGAMSSAPNREAEGFPDSGYQWPKTMLWKGMRTSPGSLWFFYVVFVTAGFMSVALSALMAFPTHLLRSICEKCALHEALIGGIEYLLAGALIFVGLGVAQLSDVVELYLVGMTTIQLLFSVIVFEMASTSHHAGMWELLFGFQLGAVIGIALLDSYHPLNVLNAIYSTLGLVVIGQLGSRLCRPVAVLGQVGFSISAYLVADEVEGVHRLSMLVLLSTACFFTVLIFCLQCCIDPSERIVWQGGEPRNQHQPGGRTGEERRDEPSDHGATASATTSGEGEERIDEPSDHGATASATATASVEGVERSGEGGPHNVPTCP